MAKTRLIGEYPVIGIRPTIDGRRCKKCGRFNRYFRRQRREDNLCT